MRLIMLLLLVLLTWNGVMSAHVNPFLHSENYMVQTVQSGDTVWQIAANYVSDKDDIRSLIAAIIELNHLDKNAGLKPGQNLKIPLRK